MFNQETTTKLNFYRIPPLFWAGILAIFLVQSVSAQTFTRRNSPYSRYGIGDPYSSQFMVSQQMGGGLTATYHNIGDYNPSNPASLGHLRSATFDMGIFYKYAALNESSTGEQASSNDGNLTYMSLAFPITRSWEVERDSLRRGIPIQWGMGFCLQPHSTVAYDVRVVRDLEDIGEVLYQYAGNGTRYRVNWSNAVRYKGLSIGANLGFLFGTTRDVTGINFLDSAYVYAYNESFLREEYSTGLLWDFGLQYDYYLQNRSKPSLVKDMYLTFGAYVNGSSNLQVLSKERNTRYGAYYSRDTLLDSDDLEGRMQLPLTVGGGLALNKGLFWRIGLNYEASFWANQFDFDLRPINMGNSYVLALGGEFCPMPKDLNITKYAQRIRYRAGMYYGKDPRIIGTGTDALQLNKYGLSLGVGLPMKPLKSGILGYVNTGFELGYLGHPDLINELFFQFNLAFTLNDGSWFRRSKFR